MAEYFTKEASDSVTKTYNQIVNRQKQKEVLKEQEAKKRFKSPPSILDCVRRIIIEDEKADRDGRESDNIPSQNSLRSYSSSSHREIDDRHETSDVKYPEWNSDYNTNTQRVNVPNRPESRQNLEDIVRLSRQLADKFNGLTSKEDISRVKSFLRQCFSFENNSGDGSD